MKTTTRNTLLVLGVFLIIALMTLFSMQGHGIVIEGEEINGVAGVGIGILGCAIGLLAAFFALSLTGLILAAVALFLVLLGVVIFGAVAIALSPLLLPLFFLMGVVWLFNRGKRA
ncbi:MAG: hypothetical protein V4447_09765 [Pseudomonadota bacterium]